MNPRDFAERAILGALLSQPEIAYEIGHLRPEDFRSPPHRILYHTITEMVAAREREAYSSAERSDLDDVVRDADADTESAPTADYPTEVTPVTVLACVRASGELGADRSSVLTAAGLHTLMATAPPPHAAQPQAWAAIVIEASIRRDIEASGLRVGRAAETSADLNIMLDQVDLALDQVRQAQQRWHALAAPAQPGPVRLAPVPDAVRDSVSWSPTPEQTADAEYAVVEQVLAEPAVLDELGADGGGLDPADFADARTGNAFRAAVAVHAESRTSGVRVDAVTVAWAQQRGEPQHGPGLAPETLGTMSRTPPLGAEAARASAAIVVRASITRITVTAATSVQAAAQHPGLMPADLLHTAEQAFAAVKASSHRLVAPAQLAQLAGTGTAPARSDHAAPEQTPARACAAPHRAISLHRSDHGR